MNDLRDDIEKHKAEKEEREASISRRRFLTLSGWGAILTTCGGSAVLTYHYLSPNVLFEPPTAFEIGEPEKYPLDSVTLERDKRIIVVHDKDGFFCLSAICPHLGCMTEWRQSEGIIKCPCHGSKFSRNGGYLEGPAPAGLASLKIELNDDGELFVDTLETVGPEYRLAV